MMQTLSNPTYVSSLWSVKAVLLLTGWISMLLLGWLRNAVRPPGSKGLTSMTVL